MSDPIREALTELVACHTDAANFKPEMAKNRTEFGTFLAHNHARIDAALASARSALSAQPAPVAEDALPEPVGYLPAYELDRMRSGHDGRARSAKYGPSCLDDDVPLYTADQMRAAIAAERERCAAICDQRSADHWHDYKDTASPFRCDSRTEAFSDEAEACAKAIREA